jgi:nicotinic acid phosphoribosyltransferase
MSQRDEAEAYEKWNSVFKNPTVLIDTYDPVKAIDKLISKSIKPFAVRIDSDPLAEYAVAIREKLNNYGWNDVKIFISGDLTPEILREFEDRNIPFDMCMAGTKYANIGDFETINAGFVYKLVEVHDEYGIFYPEKKSIGKKNYSGLKRVEIYPDYIKVKKDWDGFGIRTFPEAEKPKDKVIFESWEDFA